MLKKFLSLCSAISLVTISVQSMDLQVQNSMVKRDGLGTLIEAALKQPVSFELSNPFYLPEETGHQIAQELISDSNLRKWLMIRQKQQIFYDEKEAKDVSFSPDGTHLISASTSKSAQLWDLREAQKVHRIPVRSLKHESWVTSAEFSPDGEYIVTGETDNTVHLWSSQTGACIRTFSGQSAKFDPTGAYILVVDIYLPGARIFDILEGTCVKILHHNDIRSASYNLLGTFAVTNGYKTTKIWDIKTQQCIKTLTADEGYVYSTAFDPSGTYIITAGEDKTAKLWNIQTGKSLRIFQGHEKSIRSVVFHPSDTYMATGSDDAKVKLWDITTGLCFHTFKCQSRVNSLAFNKNGTQLAVGSAYGTELFELDPLRLVARAISFKQALLLK